MGVASPKIFAQSDKEKVGSDQKTMQMGGLYDFSDPNKVNIEVNVWGYARNSGKFIVPKGSTFQDLLSYSGGPQIEANLEDIRIYRPKNDSLGILQDKIIILDYNDLLWNDKINLKKVVNPILEPGDVVIFTGGPRYFFRDNLTLITSIASLLFSIAILIVTITKK